MLITTRRFNAGLNSSRRYAAGSGGRTFSSLPTGERAKVVEIAALPAWVQVSVTGVEVLMTSIAILATKIPI
jgi:hypothetical protein